MPEISGVYVLYFTNILADFKELVYIGRSTNIAKRFSGHKLYYELLKQEDGYNRYLAAKVKETECHKELEKLLIQKLRPKYNKVFNWGII